MFRVLLIGDKNCAIIPKQMIIELGCDCLTIENGEDALDMVNEEKLDVVLIHSQIAVKNNFEFLAKASNLNLSLPIILFEELARTDLAIQAMKLGAFDILQKPVTRDKIEKMLHEAIEPQNSGALAATELSTEQQSCSLQDIVGKSQCMNDVAKRVIKVAQTEANVMIYGESGTGKELIAKNIHLHSDRRNKPFVPLDCVSLPSNLIESELFGYERGAFTGADKEKTGLIELADGGTVFLDEIAELDMYLQAKLLRLLQERQFRRIGGKNLINVNIRIISATNMDPEKAVQQHKLRQDLYYRLIVVPIHVPPLRERKEDIPLLVNHFIEKFSPFCKKNVTGMSNEAMQHLKRYDWPGNVRELQNAIEQAMSFTEHEVISTEDLPEKISENIQIYEEDFFQSGSFKQAREKYMRKFCEHYFNSMMKKYEGNISKVAQESQLSRGTVYRILQDISDNFI